MAKKRLVFDPNEDPKTGYEKWSQELLRITNEPVSANLVGQEKEARKNMRYFGQKMKEPKTETGPEAEPLQTERTSDKYYKPKKKPWPGWGKKIEELAMGTKKQ